MLFEVCAGPTVIATIVVSALPQGIRLIQRRHADQ